MKMGAASEPLCRNFMTAEKENAAFKTCCVFCTGTVQQCAQPVQKTMRKLIFLEPEKNKMEKNYELLRRL
jgi:hypothetical protein